jgi:hypothetical protein
MIRLAATLALLWAAGAVSLAQDQAPFNERDARRQQNVEDRNDIWVLDFRFKDPRLITVDIPGKGKRVVWYLWYQVINRNSEPITFIPDFELVTHDKPGVYHDKVLPRVQEAIRRIEDPTNYLDIKNSVTITQQPIPVSKEEAAPRAVTGVATWDDVDPDSNRYSIFVAGLSNGWSVDDKGVVRRKVLQLNFKRLGDRFLMDSREIRFVPPTEWLYRPSTINVQELLQPGPEKKEIDKAVRRIDN